MPVDRMKINAVSCFTRMAMLTHEPFEIRFGRSCLTVGSKRLVSSSLACNSPKDFTILIFSSGWHVRGYLQADTGEISLFWNTHPFSHAVGSSNKKKYKKRERERKNERKWIVLYSRALNFEKVGECCKAQRVCVDQRRTLYKSHLLLLLLLSTAGLHTPSGLFRSSCTMRCCIARLCQGHHITSCGPRE